MPDCSAEAIGKRVKKLRNNYNKNGKRLSQEEFAKKIGYSREQVAKWETGKQPLMPEQLQVIASFFGVSIDKLVTDTESENRLVAESTGLTDASIAYLKEMKQRENDYQGSFVEVAEAMANSMDDLKVSPDKPVVEGGTSGEVLFMVNWLLSNTSGHNLLSMLAKYCLTESSQCFRYDSLSDQPYPLEEINEIYYKNRVGEGWTMFNPAVLRYALIPAINDEINTIRKEIVKGDK